MKKKESTTKKEFAVDNDKLLPSDENITKVEVSDSKILNEAQQKIEEQKSKRSKIFNVSFFLINILVLVIILVIQLNSDGITSISNALNGKIGLRYIFLAFGTFFAIMLVETLRTFILIWRSTKKIMPIISYKSTALEKYYDAITPLSIGGQPFMVWYLSKWKIKPSVATSIPMAKLIYSQITFVIVSIVMLLLNLKIFNSYAVDSSIVYTISIVALVLITLLIVGVFVLSTSKKVAPKLVMGVLKLGHKMHLVKDYETTFVKIMRHVLEYQTSMKYFAKSIFTSFGVFILSAGIYFLKALVPYFIYLAMATTPTVTYFEIFARIILCDLVAHIIPFPGGAGMVEFSFTAVFSSLFADGTLFWAMLFYRIVSYYSYLLQGISIIVYDFFIGDKRRKNRSARIEKRRAKKLAHKKAA